MRLSPRLGLVGAIAVIGACSESSPSSPSNSAHDSIQPTNWDAEIRPTLATDNNSEPNVFETHLTAELKQLEIVPGKLTEVYTYGGTVPAPEIRVKRGDRVIVHLENKLPEATSIHWHGLRVPNDVDGVPGVTQDPVEPGESFTYDFVVRDAGTFWFHPHVRSAAQVGFGMYGSFVVTDPDEPEDMGDDLTLVLSDISVDDEGKLLPADTGTWLDTYFGREGNVFLVNGRVNPTLKARSGRRQRWRIINAARSRYFTLHVPGEDFVRFGGDAGMIEHPTNEENVVLVPGERAEVLFDAEADPGSILQATWLPTDRGFGTLLRDEAPLFRVEMSQEDRYQDEELPPLGRSIEPIDVTSAKDVSLIMTRELLEDGTFQMGINGVPFWEAEPLQAKIGETQIWSLGNSMDFAHPFHLHGYFFQVLSIDGVEPEVKEWKDTVDIHVDGETRIAVHFDERPGMWMTHCHILDHAEAGMMTMVEVKDPEALGAAGAASH